jgi:hypothetical protein
MISISMSLIYIASSLMEIDLLLSLDKGDKFTDEELDANDSRVSIIASFSMMTAFSSLVIFYVWFYKAYKNLPSLGGKELLFSARWIILRFFIPILGLYQPYQATKEIWKSSDPRIRESDKTVRKQMSTPSLIKVWWAFWIITEVIGLFYLRGMSTMMNVDTISGFIALNYVAIFTVIPMIISDVLTFFLVRKISFNQENKSQSYIQ